MSKQITIICRGQSIGCSEKRTLITANDNGESICPKCDKRLTELQARKRFEEEKKQEKINNPSKCLTCSVKINQGQRCKSCLEKNIRESFQQSQKASEGLNELEKTKENNNKLKDSLLDWLANLEKKDTNQDNSKVEEIEAQIKQNQADIARTKQEIEENNKRNNSSSNSSNNLSPYNTPSSKFNHSNNSPPVQTPNQQENIKCYNCKKRINQGDDSYYLAQIPDKKWCGACDSEVKTCFQATQQIFAGQIIDVDNLNISKENKIELLIITKLKNGESVDIDKFHIDQESKAGLKEIQSQFEQGKIPTNRKPNLGDKFISVCSDCKQGWSYKFKAPTHCQSCHSKKIKIYDAEGFLQQTISPQSFYAKVSFWIEAVIVIICIIWTIYQIFRWRKAKREGKKYNWWTNKIS